MKQGGTNPHTKLDERTQKKEKWPPNSRRVRDSPLLLLLGIPKEHPATNHRMYSNYQAQIHTGPEIIASDTIIPYDHFSVVSGGCVLIVSLTPLAHSIFHLLYCVAPQSSASCFIVGLYICFHQLLDSTSEMKIGHGVSRSIIADIIHIAEYH